MAIKIAIAGFGVLMLTSVCRCQRPPFAGSRPIGFPEISTQAVALADRFGEANGTTERLPIEALGDRDLVDRLSKLPKDKQPFWLLNWQALEENRKRPQTYPQRPNSFLSNNMNNQDVGPSSQSSTATTFGSVETSGSSTGSGPITENFEKVNVNSTSVSNGNLDNASRNSSSLRTVSELILNSTPTRSDVSGTNSQDNKNFNGKEKINIY